jgi:hypothetical protein
MPEEVIAFRAADGNCYCDLNKALEVELNIKLNMLEDERRKIAGTLISSLIDNIDNKDHLLNMLGADHESKYYIEHKLLSMLLQLFTHLDEKSIQLLKSFTNSAEAIIREEKKNINKLGKLNK